MSLRQSSFRACEPCRRAKVKCDFQRPVCGRCARRRTHCFGYSDDPVRDQTAAIEARVERRARQERSQPRTQPTQAAVLSASIVDDDANSAALPWLRRCADLAPYRHLTGDSDSRAVDHFFTNWILWPCNHHISPGHLQDIPALYEQSLPGTAIRLAIEALAYAEIPNHHTKAWTKYGHALGRVRDIISDPGRNKKDSVLAALLIIDNFELMHKGRTEPLGPHSTGLIYLLHARGDDQLLNRRSFALWRIAHHRLQARQLLLKEAPSSEQEKWVTNLNVEQPDLHITQFVFNISKINAQGNDLLRPETTTASSADDITARTIDFVTKSDALVAECRDWRHAVPEAWKPQVQTFPQPTTNQSTKFPPRLLPSISLHHDIWLAYMWNFQNASSIIVRECIIDVLTSPALKDHIPPTATAAQERIAKAKDLIHEFSVYLLQTMPQLLGLVDYKGNLQTSGRDPSGQKIGQGLGGFFAMFALWVVKACKYTTDEHKGIAEDILTWLQRQNSRL